MGLGTAVKVIRQCSTKWSTVETAALLHAVSYRQSPNVAEGVAGAPSRQSSTTLICFSSMAAGSCVVGLVIGNAFACSRVADAGRRLSCHIRFRKPPQARETSSYFARRSAVTLKYPEARAGWPGAPVETPARKVVSRMMACRGAEFPFLARTCSRIACHLPFTSAAGGHSPRCFRQPVFGPVRSFHCAEVNHSLCRRHRGIESRTSHRIDLFRPTMVVVVVSR